MGPLMATFLKSVATTVVMVAVILVVEPWVLRTIPQGQLLALVAVGAGTYLGINWFLQPDLMRQLLHLGKKDHTRAS